MLEGASALPPLDRMLTDAVNCTGWPQSRVYLEAQKWITTTADVLQSGHVHIGSCVPYNKTLSGTQTFDVLVQLHNAPTSRIDEIHIITNDGTNGAAVIMSKYVFATPFVCPAVNANRGNLCKTAVRMTVATALNPYDGLTTLKFKAVENYTAGYVPPTNEAFTLFLASLNARVVLKNSKPKNPYVPKRNGGRAFVKEVWEYTAVYFEGDFPLTARKGNWTTDLVVSETERGNVTATFVSVDPNFHNVDSEGMVQPLLGTQQQAFAGPIRKQILVNTTALSNGYHKLFMRADSFFAPGVLSNSTQFGTAANPFGGGTLSGALLVGFLVQNP
ncbi:hypothetical protein JKP88DRAFT_178757 [Tribonema minus]|uniref:Uncharacterized protein n=1 Tax=Tribonema minus TaxID=303371 RepID=A0A835Z6L1_9STRA|nr:hypothetical protein JKP88DRAFT_178757 [Tribonema minus]